MANYGHRCRSGKHVILKPSDKRSNGACAACSRENEARYRSKLRNAYTTLSAAHSGTA